MLNNILGIVNKTFGFFSPSERKRRRRNKIWKLREERVRLVFLPSTSKTMRRISRIDDKLSRLYRDAEDE